MPNPSKPTMDAQDILEYYSRRDIQEEIVRCSKDKETVGNFNNMQFSKRPDTIQYPQEVIEAVKSGVTSFHVSEEAWHDVYKLNIAMDKKELDNLRKGWDLILDIDSKNIEISKIVASLIVKALKFNEVRSISVKFSGNKGFHIAVPFEAFPQTINNVETRLLFPELPRMIANYIANMISPKISEIVIEKFQLSMPSKFKAFSESVGIDQKDLIINDQLNVEKLIAIDTILINSRHLCRMVYSLNEKSGLASIPVALDKIESFEREMARPEYVKVQKNVFLRRDDVIPNEAKQLVLQAMDFDNSKKSKMNEEKRLNDLRKKLSENHDDLRYKDIVKILPEAFPPCMNGILAGIADGRKRGIFALMCFLQSANYSNDEIDLMVHDWNKKNPEPLREVYVKGQLNQIKKKKISPPNCDNSVYKDIFVCKPDGLCPKCKNPIVYAMKKHFFLTRVNEEKQKELEKAEKKKVKEEQKKAKAEKKKEKQEAKQKDTLSEDIILNE